MLLLVALLTVNPFHGFAPLRTTFTVNVGWDIKEGNVCLAWASDYVTKVDCWSLTVKDQTRRWIKTDMLSEGQWEVKVMVNGYDQKGKVINVSSPVVGVNVLPGGSQ